MATNITQYNATAGSNTSIDSINLQEGQMVASDVNNAIRSLMSHLKNVDTGSQALTALSVTGNVSVGGTFTSRGIDDNADATAITIDSSEKVGIGTSSPSQLLDVVGSSANIRVAESSGGDLRMNVSGSTGGIGTHSNHPLLFRTNSTERMRMDSSGRLLVGLTSASGSASAVLQARGTGVSAAVFDRASNDGVVVGFKRNGGNDVGNISITTSSTAYNTSSDHRLKENVEDMTGAIDRVKQLSPKRFNFIADETNTLFDGFLAHEAQSVVAEAVTGTHNEVDDDGNAVMQGIDQAKLVPLLTGALKEAITKIEALEARVTALENA